MTDLRKAAEMALEALEWINRVNAMDYEYQRKAQEPIQALRQALAQPEQEPFGYFRYDLEWDGWVETEPDNGKPLYTAPPIQQEMLKQAYLDGVNSGLAAIRARSEK